MKFKSITPTYVEQFPDELLEGVLYVCEEFNLTAHKCFCGCGEDVYNKLGHAKWQLTKTGDGRVSLWPSIGNWKYACKSHYIIRHNLVIDAGPMRSDEIEEVIERDRRDRDIHLANLRDRPASKWGRAIGLLGAAAHHLRARFFRR